MFEILKLIEFTTSEKSFSDRIKQIFVDEDFQLF